ncbi:hypothetical protein ACJJTC_013557 [Scirpophaga incertulas]
MLFKIQLLDVECYSESMCVVAESEAAVTSLWRRGWTVTAGFRDGGVRAWDERRGAEPATLYVRYLYPRPVKPKIAFNMTDKRKLCYQRPYQQPVKPALRGTNLNNQIRCGSVNQCISVYDLDGAHLNTIKFHEGFMGARIGPVSCLAFHPLRVALGVGSKDSSVSVYVGEGRR